MFLFFLQVLREAAHSFQEPLDLRSNPFQGGGDDPMLPPLRAFDRRLQED